MSTSLSINPPSFSIITTTPSSPSSFSSSSFSTSSSSYTSVSPRLLSLYPSTAKPITLVCRQARFSPSEGASRLRRRTLAAKGDMTITEMGEEDEEEESPPPSLESEATSRPRRIALFVEPSPFAYVSGYKNRFQNFIRYLREMGDEVMVVTTHEGVPQEFYGAKLIGSRRAADLTLVPSAAIARDLQAARVTAANRIRLWNKGVDSESFHPRYYSHEMRLRLSNGEPEKPLVIHVGRLGVEKSLDFLKSLLRSLKV